MISMNVRFLTKVTRQALVAAGAVAVVAAAGLGVRMAVGGDGGSSIGAHAASVPVAGSPIGPQAATSLGMTITAPAAAQLISTATADQAAVASWPGCTVGHSKYVHMLWSNRDPRLDSDVFLVPLHCTYGMSAAHGAGPGMVAPQLPAATFKVAIVSASGTLVSTITGASSDPAPQ